MSFLCRFCGGKKCKHENWKTQENSAIEGLNSTWITMDILACQRPSSRIIDQYDLIASFKKQKIFSLYCLQENGEHPHCGDGIHKGSGLSYHPSEFMNRGVGFFDYGWKDHNTTSIKSLLKIMKSIDQRMVDGKKIAVHCHAGRGRTALVICAYLIYKEDMSAE